MTYTECRLTPSQRLSDMLHKVPQSLSGSLDHLATKKKNCFLATMNELLTFRENLCPYHKEERIGQEHRFNNFPLENEFIS